MKITNKTVMIFHHIDADGKCAGYWVKEYYLSCCDIINKSGDETVAVDTTNWINYDIICIPINYGENIDEYMDMLTKDTEVYIVDFSFDPEILDKMYSITKHITWIDHHISAIDKYSVYESKHGNLLEKVPGVRSTLLSGCALTWFYLNGFTIMRDENGLITEFIPTFRGKMDEIEAKTANSGNDYIINIKQKEFGTNREEFYRKINMPYATRFIAEHDLWCFDNPVVKPFILGIGNFDIIKHSDYEAIDEIMHVQDDSTTDYDQILDIIKDGSTILNDRMYNLYPAMMKSSVTKKFDVDQITNPVSDDVREKISKLTAVVLEMPGCFNSDVFGEARNTADVCVKYHFTSNGVTYTFYTTANSPVNAKTLAEAYGGGGHIHAAGTHRDADKTILI